MRKCLTSTPLPMGPRTARTEPPRADAGPVLVAHGRGLGHDGRKEEPGLVARVPAAGRLRAVAPGLVPAARVPALGSPALRSCVPERHCRKQTASIWANGNRDNEHEQTWQQKAPACVKMTATHVCSRASRAVQPTGVCRTDAGECARRRRKLADRFAPLTRFARTWPRRTLARPWWQGGVGQWGATAAK